ncbi:MAG TPA: FlgD immunoglobulin-like domain containing protein, partial [bacterium]|nr:FlgD immunoglobulin-like domain containing protein [bacterium]
YQDPGGPLAVDGDGQLFDEDIHALSPETAYHWRARLQSESPYFPNSIWLTPAPGLAGFLAFRSDDGLTTDVPAVASTSSVGLRFESLHPNPGRHGTEVRFSLERAHDVRVDVIDVTGRRVSTLADARFASGRHELAWNGTDERGRTVAAGVYWVRVSGGGVAEARSVTLLR